MNNPKVAAVVFALLIVTYILNGLRMAESIWFTMDEGSYLIKGYWFLTGQARPFEINGPITNKPPLAFLIPGLSQLIQPGIASGRMINVFLLAGSLVGLWMTLRRQGHAWWGNLALLLVVINPAWVEYYTRVMTQTPTVFFLVWSLYFGLGKERGLGQLMIAAGLGVLMVFTRHNVAFYLPIFWIYLVWEHGLKKASVAFLPAAFLFVAVNALYWPGIFSFLWAKSLPSQIADGIFALSGIEAPFNPKNQGSEPVTYSTLQIIQEFFGAARISLAAIWTAFCALLIIPGSRFDKSESRQLVFLSLLFWVQLFVHILVVFDMNVLLYSFPAYLLFWGPAIFLVMPEIAQRAEMLGRGWRLWAQSLFLVILGGGVGLHLYRTISLPLMNLKIPRLRNWQILPGEAELWRTVVNKFGIEFRQQEYLLAWMIGLVGGLVVVGLVWLLGWLAVRMKMSTQAGAAHFLLSLLLIALFTPTPLLSGKTIDDQCDSGTLNAIERVGAEISAQVEPGSLIFWGVHTHPTVGVLLYVEDVRVFPEQLNGQFYYNPGISLAESQASNEWSDAQAKEWLREADYLIADPGHLAHWDEMLAGMPEVEVDQLTPTSPLEPCDPRSTLYIFRLGHSVEAGQ